MPSGYTCGVNDGTVTDLNAFVLICAKAFGACIMQRNDPASDPSKVQPKDTYHQKALVTAQENLAKLKKMTIAQANKKAAEEHEKAVQDGVKSKIDNMKVEARYQAMIAKVTAWIPPTPDHQNLKDFMLKQLDESINWDVLEDKYFKAPALKTGAEWLADQMMHEEHNIKYHTENQVADDERTNSRNKWITDLYTSLR
jgi:hypothetical protein